MRLALNFKHIPYKPVPVNLLKGEHKTPEYLRVNPHGVVPALRIDGALLAESLAIIEYLEETRQCATLPRACV